MMFRSRILATRIVPAALLACLCACIGVPIANAHISDDPLEFRIVDVRTAAGISTWTLEFEAGRAGELAAFQIGGLAVTSQEMGNEARARLSIGATSQFTVQAPTAATDKECVVRYFFDGRPYSATLQLSSTPPEAMVGRLYRVLDPANAEAAIGPGLDFGGNEPPTDQIVREFAKSKKRDPRDITVHGRVMYLRPAIGIHPAVYIGASRATVEVFDDDFGLSDPKGSTTTDWDGYFSHTFHWDPTWPGEADPDIYVTVTSSNSWVKVEKPIIEFAYSWRFGTTWNVTGTDLDVGNLAPSEDRPALHILTNTTRAYRWMDENGYPPSFVEVKWPSNDFIESHYSADFQTIHIRDDSEWDDATHVHEYGHHWTNSFGTFVIPTYLDPHCGVFGHCPWCSENDIAAFIEGWADWISDMVLEEFSAKYTIPSTSDEDTERLYRCDGVFNYAFDTEGFFTALLRDVEDDANEDDPAFLGDAFQDVLSLGSDEILAVADLDAPTTTGGFIADFLTRFPELGCEFRSTARNNGFEIGPGPVAGLTAGPAGGPLACAPPTNNREFSWTPPPGDGSCMDGYSILIAATAQMPDAVQDIGDVTEYTSPCQGPGSYVFNIRARDSLGNWSLQFASYPFTFSGPPIAATPILLSAERVGSDVRLEWTAGVASSMRDYIVYRTTSSGVEPISVNYLASAMGTVLVDSHAPATTLYYVVVATDAGGDPSRSSNEVLVEAAEGISNTAPPLAFAVRQNYPNPFATSTEFEVGLVRQSEVTIDVFDVAGRRVMALDPRTQAAGWKRITLDSRDAHGRLLPSGIYFYRVRAAGSEVVRKMVIAR